MSSVFDASGLGTLRRIKPARDDDTVPPDATGGLAMRTTFLAYVIAIVGLVLIVAGARDIYLLHNEETFEVTLSDYETPIRTIAGGLAMIGLAQALRLLRMLLAALPASR
jgi:hypothetical protein